MDREMCSVIHFVVFCCCFVIIVEGTVKSALIYTILSKKKKINAVKKLLCV